MTEAGRTEEAGSFDTLLIVGGGLIGSSIARAARGRVRRIVIADNSLEAREALERLEIADAVVADACKGGSADLVVLCTPPAAMRSVVESLGPGLAPGAVVTDVGSYKAGVAEIAELLPDGVQFIPGHPIAGTEFSGPEAGRSDLFRGRWCVLTPPANTDTDADALARLRAFWEAMGSEVAIMDPAHHDTVLATTSHVPHLIAYTLVGTATDMERVTDGEVVKFSAGGFRDFTRIAASDPALWRDVMLGNRQAVLEVVERVIEDLSALKRAIRWGDGEFIEAQFGKAAEVRRGILDAGQDEPGFGRGESKT